MKERTTNGIGLVAKRTNFLSVEKENKLWEEGILGKDNPSQLRDTVLFSMSVDLGLCADAVQFIARFK